MAHKNMVDGTVYDITAGRSMVGGTVYDIGGGRTLIGGTGYDIAFSFDIVITGEGERTSTSTYIMYVEVQGQKYIEAATLEGRPNETIYLYVRNSSQGLCQNIISINGEQVATSSGKTAATYTYQVPAGVRVVNIDMAKMGDSWRRIKLTTE